MENQHIYLLAQFDADTNKLLADIYQKLNLAGLKGKQTPNLPYHFTLGRFNTEQENQMIDFTEKACQNIKSFDIQLSHIGLFGLEVLFVAPTINRELLHLHDTLAPRESTSDDHNWVAHTTIIIDEPSAIQKVLPIVAQSFSPITAKIESIGVYEFFPTRFIKNIYLSS